MEVMKNSVLGNNIKPRSQESINIIYLIVTVYGYRNIRGYYDRGKWSSIKDVNMDITYKLLVSSFIQ